VLDERTGGADIAGDQLEESLRLLIREKPGRPSRESFVVAQALLKGIQRRPQGAIAVVVTDGTKGGDDESEE
jgi:hypothetical protein